jgi:hypothetical protein
MAGWERMGGREPGESGKGGGEGKLYLRVLGQQYEVHSRCNFLISCESFREIFVTAPCCYSNATSQFVPFVP